MPLRAKQDNACLRLFAPNAFVLDWVETHHKERIESLCRRYSDDEIQHVAIQVGSPSTKQRARTKGQEKADKASIISNLNPELNFDAFVEGKSNQIARAASLQIGQRPGKAYNPFFIYGGVGLGKTHLMHAVGNLMQAQSPTNRVLYIHSERFVADMVRALQHNTITNFKKHYRSLNALLIDDVQFFAGKERSQEEFFHTFNALFESKQQIILTSDRYPKEVQGLEERLKSRFGWGLTVAIDPPDLETRVAILHSKATMLNVRIPEDVAFFVAQQIKNNIRELEGALRRLVANSEFTGQAISLDFAREALRDLLVAQTKLVTIENIQKVVAEYYHLRTSDLISGKRTRAISRPRQMAMTLAKDLTKHSLPEIGAAFGGRDHTTVLHAIRKIRALKDEEVAVEEDYRNLCRILSM